MLRMLTRGSRMTQLYLEYLRQRTIHGEDSSAVLAILASIKSLIADEKNAQSTVSDISRKRRFERYQKGLSSLSNSVDPSVGI